MRSVIKAAYPKITKLAYEHYSWELEENSSNTLYKKASVAAARQEVADALVSESLKLGSMLLETLKNTKAKEDLIKKKSTKEEEEEDKEKEALYSKKESALSPGKALGYGALASIPLGLTANYAIDKAGDEVDSKMYAIPGLAAATVGAILAMRNSGGSGSKAMPAGAEELQDAVAAKQILDSVKTSGYSIHTKMASINTNHIANLITDLLVR